MNTVQLECFLAVAECLNFSKAAEVVKISQPAVSHQINSLEQELGTRLFVRTSKSVKLTRAGMQFMGDAVDIMKIANTAKVRLRDQGREQIVTLDIGCHNQFELNLLPGALKRLMAEQPELHPSVKVVPVHSMDNLLERESIQLMFGYKKERGEKVTGIYQELLRCPVRCVCSADHPLAKRDSLTEDELDGGIVLSDPHAGPKAVFGIQNRTALRKPSAQLFFGGGYESTVALVRAGAGFTLLPDIPAAREPGLRYIAVSGMESLSFGVYYKTLKGNPALRRLIGLLREELSGASVTDR
ncbi:LysR family transcriptional regulator [Bacilliculturomica massiliensis]|uniref:LysR family transcriptional regulator n=1 Tax=Bacilliculturomica massiliensis TaxID=1917867 RepID=UPI0010323826|nr:LysR family transcriptional regulator [Bacilliculturomica massiliensis]